LKGTNFGIGPDILQDLTTGTQNTALGNGAGMETYGLTTGSGNVMVGYNSGGGCQTGSNNTFLGTNTLFFIQWGCNQHELVSQSRRHRVT